jgi:class 3 adenylate cyclase
VLFVDVVDFTSFAAQADAREVVACLNELFEVVVPVIARHGGHVDKFEGDGLLAVFGAPERMPDHADRALRAALELTRRVNGDAGIHGDGGSQQGEVRFRIGAGINSGEVVAGAIGGGGRLNFSVIGDAVNVAARVEAVTRKTGDGVLITEATRRALRNDFELAERGTFELKGIDEEVPLYAPSPVDAGADGRPPPSPVPGSLAGSEAAILRSRT